MLEIIANNLANLNTTGFKGDKVSFQALLPEPNKHYNNPLPPANYKLNFEDMVPLVGNEISHVGIADIKRDLSQGPAITTHHLEDVMIEGPGYLQIQSRDGVRYTRDGALSRSADGILMTKTGEPVLGAKGTIYLKAGEFEINGRGEIYQNNEMVDRLLLFDFNDEDALERVGTNAFFYGGADQDRLELEHPQIRQGYLEGSNVNAIKNLTNMIVAHRSFEAYQKAVSNYDSMMDKSSNSIGQVQA